MIQFRHEGNFHNTDKFLKQCKESNVIPYLDEYGERGVAALASATPVDTGKTAASWYYTVTYEKDQIVLSFNNSNINNYVNIAVIIQTGHATRSGSWIEGRDYINPAIRPVFDKIANDVWKEVTK